MNISRDQLIGVFEDTMFLSTHDEYLKASIKYTIDNTRIYDKDELVDIHLSKDKSGDVSISRHRSFEAAKLLKDKYPNSRIGVLNFANAFHPGGGVRHGSRAQEEALCRCSTLYPCIDTPYVNKHYYSKNSNEYSELGTDRVVYTPHIIVFKSDTDLPTVLKKDKYYEVDVLTCAAPNLRERSSSLLSIATKGERINDEELFNIHLKRARHIIHAAINNKIDVLVLGAFGCGAFQNNPYVVAKAYKEILKEYRYEFLEIEFAIYCRDYEDENYIAFRKTL